MEDWITKDWILVFSATISLVSVSIVIYKEFISGAKLETVLSTLVFIRTPEENKSMMLTEILIEDLLSGRPLVRL